MELAPHFEWFQWSNPVTIWWVFLVVVSSLNMLFWSWTRLYFRNLKSPVVLLSAFYVFGCAFRSFLPRADVQRIVLFDTWWSSVFVGRTVATIAELAFVAQWAIVLKAVAASLAQNEARHSSTSRTTAWVTKVASFIVPMIVFAEVCSWYAVITTNYIGNSIEESTWAFTYSLIGVSLALLYPKLSGPMKYVAGLSVFGCILYVIFMVTVDVPMYVGRLLQDIESGKPYLGLVDGFRDLNTRWHVTHDIQEWRTEIPWKSLYFSVAVWVSLALCYVPLTTERLQKHFRK
ncbi:MAG: hypothetical protein U1E10_08465 [Bdellovibrionales bacterium]|nr:hypothetical protein [Bdellovibrionales bacterium]